MGPTEAKCQMLRLPTEATWMLRPKAFPYKGFPSSPLSTIFEALLPSSLLASSPPPYTRSKCCSTHMATSPVESITTTACDHCGREIPSLNIDLHVVHCFRNLEKCTICGTMIPKKHAEEHYMDEHAPVTCSLCSQKVERDVLEVHKVEICAQRIVSCKYCEFPLPAVDLFHHQDSCGNRTELCLLCHVYVRRRDQLDHDIQHSIESNAASSRHNGSTDARRDPPGRQPPHSSLGRVWATIAITGVAVLIGSIFLQRRTDDQQDQ